jgi:hypothetical protein
MPHRSILAIDPPLCPRLLPIPKELLSITVWLLKIIPWRRCTKLTVTVPRGPCHCDVGNMLHCDRFSAELQLNSVCVKANNSGMTVKLPVKAHAKTRN